MDVEELAVALREEARCANERRLLVLAGDRDAGAAAARRALDAADRDGSDVGFLAFASTTPPLAEEDLSARLGGMVGVPADGYADRIRVVPGEPDSSLLYLKLIGDPDVGNRMPLFGSLDSLRITTIRTWIEDGARDD